MQAIVSHTSVYAHTSHILFVHRSCHLHVVGSPFSIQFSHTLLFFLNNFVCMYVKIYTVRTHIHMRTYALRFCTLICSVELKATHEHPIHYSGTTTTQQWMGYDSQNPNAKLQKMMLLRSTSVNINYLSFKFKI